MTGHLLLLDASGFAYRAFYGANPSFRSSDGLPTYAITGFLAMTFRMLGAAEADKPTHAAAIFDAPGKTFRHKMFADYKANRVKNASRRDELIPQLPYLRHAAEALGLTAVEAKGFEADDVIATLCTHAANAGMRTTVVSTDKDFHQIVQDNVVEIVNPVQRCRVLEKDVAKKFGVKPPLVPDVQALCGDAVDNIPGIDGIGELKAGALIRRYGSLEGLLAECAKGYDGKVHPTIRAALKGRRADNARLYKTLATLRRDVRLNVALEDLACKPIQRVHIQEMLKLLEAPPTVRVFFEVDPQLRRPTEKDANPYAWWEAELKAPGQRIPETPQCGYYQRRLVKGAVFIPARIWRETETDFNDVPTGREILRCEVAGEDRDAVAEWGRLCSQPIKKAKFDHMVAEAAWAKQYKPTDPCATPTKRIDWNLVEI